MDEDIYIYIEMRELDIVSCIDLFVGCNYYIT